jgi:hypothetical protein
MDKRRHYSIEIMSQFVVTPPLTQITLLFTSATGRPLVAGVGWSVWQKLSTDDLEAMRPYIRPCHQRVLEDTIEGKVALALMRQLLRPHGYRIDTEGKGWRLIGPDGVHGAHGPGAIVTWT